MDREYAQYLLDKVQRDYNLISEDFSRTRKYLWPELAVLLEKYLPQNKRVLDLGCGNARLYKFFKEKGLGMEYIGLDTSESLIRMDEKQYPGVQFLVGSGLDLPFENDYFDYVYSIAVLPHIPSKILRLRFLKEARRVLKPGGILFLTAWDFSRPREIYLFLKYSFLKIIHKSKLDFRDILNPWADKTSRYYHWFSKRELAGLAKEAGFKIKDIGRIKNKNGRRKNLYLIAVKP